MSKSRKDMFMPANDSLRFTALTPVTITLRNVIMPPIKPYQKVTPRLSSKESWAVHTFSPLWIACEDWHEKALLAEKIVSSALIEAPLAERPLCLGITRKVLTALLEIDKDAEIVGVGQAALLRISSHESWRRAASRWLSAFGADAMERWAEAFPAYTIMAMHQLGRSDHVGFR
jgi:hypothetical protein